MYSLILNTSGWDVTEYCEDNIIYYYASIETNGGLGSEKTVGPALSQTPLSIVRGSSDMSTGYPVGEFRSQMHLFPRTFNF
jgi:hypothetical protein